jgi:hypothetical protein
MVSSAPSSIGLVAVPEMRTRPLLNATSATPYAHSHGMERRSTNTCIVT